MINPPDVVAYDDEERAYADTTAVLKIFNPQLRQYYLKWDQYLYNLV